MISNSMFIDKVVVQYEVLTREDAHILALKCQKLNVSPEFFMLACRILNKDSIKKLNLLKKGAVDLSKQEVINLFNTDILKNEIQKIKNNIIKPQLFQRPAPPLPKPLAQVNAAEPQNTMPEPGDMVDKYQVKSVINRSSTAVIYKAIHSLLKTEVVLKVLIPEAGLTSTNFTEKFLADAIGNARISNPGVARTLDAGKKGNYTYVVTEYIDGSTVDKIIADFGPVGPVKAIKIMMDICKTLEHCLKLGLIHKDIKPKNIMITKTSEIKLLDFGLTPIINQPDKFQTAKRKIYEIPYFMAPEQLIDINKTDYHADLYSIGATLYFLVTGKLPFETNSLAKIVAMHLNQKPVPPSTLSNRVSKELSDLIMKLLEKAPENRYRSYSTLYNDLKDIAFKYIQDSKARKQA